MLSMAVLFGGCFPHNAKKRTIAQISEGAVLVGGIGILAAVNTGADCDLQSMPGVPTEDCKTKASTVGNIGLGMILAGLVGFIATVSTAEDDKENEAPAVDNHDQKPMIAPPPILNPPSTNPTGPTPNPNNLPQ